jgi:hypothetical protein
MAIVVIILVAEDHDVGGVWGKLGAGAALVARRKPGSAPFQRDRRERAGLLPPIEHETSSREGQGVFQPERRGLVHGQVRSRAGRIPRNRRFDGSCPEWIPGQRRRNGAVPRGGRVVLHCLARKKRLPPEV